MSKIKVYLGLPSTGNTASFQMHQLRKIEKKYAEQIELVWPENLVIRFGHDFARNMIVEEFLKSDCDILWQLDADVSPPEYILDLITIHGDKWQAAGAAYPVVMCHGNAPIRQLTFTVYKGSNGRGLSPAEVPTEGTDWVDGLATGCMFLKRGVFMRLEKPYFNFEREPETQRAIKGEDLGFCMKLRELGIPFFTDYSMVCSHLKEVDLLEMNNYAMSFAKKSVEAYAQRVKVELAQQVRMMSEAKKKPQIWTPGQ